MSGPARRRPVLRRLCATVLVFEAIVLVLAMPVAITISHVPRGAALEVGGGLAAAAVILAGLVGRMRWALAAGSVLQLLIIAAGLKVTALYALGVIFSALWFTGIWMAGRLEGAGPGRPPEPGSSAGPGTPGSPPRTGTTGSRPPAGPPRPGRLRDR